MIVLDDEEVVGLFLLDQESSRILLGVQGVGGDHGPLNGKIFEQCGHAGDLVGLVRDALLGDHDALAMQKGTEEVDRGRGAIATTTERFAVKGDAHIEARALTGDPIGHCGIDLIGRQSGEDPAKGGLAGRVRSSGTEAFSEIGREAPCELGDGFKACVSAKKSQHGQGQDGDKGVASSSGTSDLGDRLEQIDKAVLTAQR